MAELIALVKTNLYLSVDDEDELFAEVRSAWEDNGGDDLDEKKKLALEFDLTTKRILIKVSKNTPTTKRILTKVSKNTSTIKCILAKVSKNTSTIKCILAKVSKNMISPPNPSSLR